MVRPTDPASEPGDAAGAGSASVAGERPHGLTEADLDPDPIEAFRAWLAAAVAAELPEPTAMVVATATPEGVPSARNVLLKAVDQRGFVFYTNRASRKGRELAANPRAALVFSWRGLERQVLVTGRVETVDGDEADAYFATRPRGSQLSAWASRQSSVVAGRPTIEEWWAEAEEKFRDRPVTRPPFWGGYRVVPDTIEFWQGRPSRLHDRLRFRRSSPTEAWVLERLSP